MQLLYDRTTILSRVEAVARNIRDSHGSSPLTLIGVLNGGYQYATDLSRFISPPLEVGFVKASSYDGRSSTGTVRIELPPTVDVSDKHILVAEDVVETGQTLVTLRKYLLELGARSVTFSVLVMKAALPGIDTRFVGFIQPRDRFLVGYGMDLDEQFRNLPELYYV